MINKILFITLSNIGDVILTLPALDLLWKNFPQAQITVMTGPRPKEIFENNPFIKKLIIYEKRNTLKNNLKLFNQLKKENFDLVIDLRNSFLGRLLAVKNKLPLFMTVPKQIVHMKDRHLYKIKSLKLKAKNLEVNSEGMGKRSLYISPLDEDYIKRVLREQNITDADKLIIISPGARSHTKRWPSEKFVELIDRLSKELKLKIILVGSGDEVVLSERIRSGSHAHLLDLSGKTSLTQLACLLRKSQVVITNDSAILHLAGYLNIPVLALFGITNEKKYGPWSENSAVVKKEIHCRPCEKAQCRYGTLKCMKLITVEDVLVRVREMMVIGGSGYRGIGLPGDRVIGMGAGFKRILVVRTDRIGDVLLSTPVIKALRDNYPDSYIAAMVSPYAKEIVEGNPYLDEVIIYDKDRKHRSWLRSLKFARNLKKNKFDLALILHPTNRVHLITFFAGIARRIGYNLKLGFLLTDKIAHFKQEGQKHELEYNLDLIKYLGIEVKDQKSFMPIKQDSEIWVDELFVREGLSATDRLLAVHPAASCPSKVWPLERFAEVADCLVKKYSFKVILLAGVKDMKLAERVAARMKSPVINLAGKTSVSQLASVLKRCSLFISNDSGPVHIASAVGTPVIAIFGRSQKGLSPKRWGPTGIKDKFLHRQAGCIECLAHNCVKGFACLKAVTVTDVVSAADLILKG